MVTTNSTMPLYFDQPTTSTNSCALTTFSTTENVVAGLGLDHIINPMAARELCDIKSKDFSSCLRTQMQQQLISKGVPEKDVQDSLVQSEIDDVIKKIQLDVSQLNNQQASISATVAQHSNNISYLNWAVSGVVTILTVASFGYIKLVRPRLSTLQSTAVLVNQPASLNRIAPLLAGQATPPSQEKTIETLKQTVEALQKTVTEGFKQVNTRLNTHDVRLNTLEDLTKDFSKLKLS